MPTPDRTNGAARPARQPGKIDQLEAAARAELRQRRQPPDGYVLAQSGEHDGFTTGDLIGGLRGIARALYRCEGEEDMDMTAELHSAAFVLTALLQARQQ